MSDDREVDTVEIITEKYIEREVERRTKAIEIAMGVGIYSERRKYRVPLPSGQQAKLIVTGVLSPDDCKVLKSWIESLTPGLIASDPTVNPSHPQTTQIGSDGQPIIYAGASDEPEQCTKCDSGEHGLHPHNGEGAPVCGDPYPGDNTWLCTLKLGHEAEAPDTHRHRNGGLTWLHCEASDGCTLEHGHRGRCTNPPGGGVYGGHVAAEKMKDELWALSSEEERPPVKRDAAGSTPAEPANETEPGVAEVADRLREHIVNADPAKPLGLAQVLIHSPTCAVVPCTCVAPFPRDVTVENQPAKPGKTYSLECEPGVIFPSAEPAKSGESIDDFRSALTSELKAGVGSNRKLICEVCSERRVCVVVAGQDICAECLGDAHERAKSSVPGLTLTDFDADGFTVKRDFSASDSGMGCPTCPEPCLHSDHGAPGNPGVPCAGCGVTVDRPEYVPIEDAHQPNCPGGLSCVCDPPKKSEGASDSVEPDPLSSVRGCESWCDLTGEHDECVATRVYRGLSGKLEHFTGCPGPPACDSDMCVAAPETREADGIDSLKASDSDSAQGAEGGKRTYRCNSCGAVVLDWPGPGLPAKAPYVDSCQKCKPSAFCPKHGVRLNYIDQCEPCRDGVPVPEPGAFDGAGETGFGAGIRRPPRPAGDPSFDVPGPVEPTADDCQIKCPSCDEWFIFPGPKMTGTVEAICPHCSKSGRHVQLTADDLTARGEGLGPFDKSQRIIAQSLGIPMCRKCEWPMDTISRCEHEELVIDEPKPIERDPVVEAVAKAAMDRCDKVVDEYESNRAIEQCKACVRGECFECDLKDCPCSREDHDSLAFHCRHGLCTRCKAINRKRERLDVSDVKFIRELTLCKACKRGQHDECELAGCECDHGEEPYMATDVCRGGGCENQRPIGFMYCETCRRSLAKHAVRCIECKQDAVYNGKCHACGAPDFDSSKRPVGNVRSPNVWCPKCDSILEVVKAVTNSTTDRFYRYCPKCKPKPARCPKCFSEAVKMGEVTAGRLCPRCLAEMKGPVLNARVFVVAEGNQCVGGVDIEPGRYSLDELQKAVAAKGGEGLSAEDEFEVEPIKPTKPGGPITFSNSPTRAAMVEATAERVAWRDICSGIGLDPTALQLTALIDFSSEWVRAKPWNQTETQKLDPDAVNREIEKIEARAGQLINPEPLVDITEKYKRDLLATAQELAELKQKIAEAPAVHVAPKVTPETLKALSELASVARMQQQRLGQTIFNALRICDPHRSDLIKNTYADPFNDDTKLPAFFEELGNDAAQARIDEVKARARANEAELELEAVEVCDKGLAKHLNDAWKQRDDLLVKAAALQASIDEVVADRAKYIGELSMVKLALEGQSPGGDSPIVASIETLRTSAHEATSRADDLVGRLQAHRERGHKLTERVRELVKIGNEKGHRLTVAWRERDEAAARADERLQMMTKDRDSYMQIMRERAVTTYLDRDEALRQSAFFCPDHPAPGLAGYTTERAEQCSRCKKLADAFQSVAAGANEFWRWQGDGSDHLESMGAEMYVSITGGQLRELLRQVGWRGGRSGK